MSDKLDQIIDGRVSTAIQVNNGFLQAEQVVPAKQPNPQPPRSYSSPMDSYANEVGYNPPFNHLNPGVARPMWQIPDVSLTHTPVNTLQSAGTPNSTQTAQIIGGVVGGVKAPISGWGPVPNMQLRVASTGPLVLTASLTALSNVASDLVSFAFYRDAAQIGQIFTQTTSSNVSSPSLVSLSTIDQPPNGTHIYALYWRAGTGRLSASGTQRSLFSMNLTPN